MLNKHVLKIWNAGRTSYAKGLQLQAVLAGRHHQSQDPAEDHDTLLIVEHTPVYTIGIRTRDYSDADIKLLKATGAEFHKTNRGGLITFHGPGQLVAYPIINLKHYRCSIKWYVHALENCIINLCKKYYGLPAAMSPYTGIWINDKKVCAIGIHGSRFITTHGLALNCNVDLTWFDNIVPCGIKDKGVTSISQETKKDVGIEAVTPQFVKTFCDTFNCAHIDYPREEQESILRNLDGDRNESVQIR